MEQEQPKEGVAEEQPQEDTSRVVPEAASTEEKKTSERTYTEAEWRKMQSMKDTEAAKALRYEKELQELRREREQQRLEARQKEIAALADEPEEQAKVRRKHQIEDELRILEERKVKEQDAVQRKYDQALDLATRHNLSLEDARELMTAETPREMEFMAQLKEKEKGQDKVKSEIFRPDSATSDAAPSDFKQLERNFIKDPYTYGKQYKEALAKRGRQF